MKKQVIEITESAQQEIKRILENKPEQALRLGINNKGCNGHSYTFEIIDRRDITNFDEIINIDSEATVVVAVGALLNLLGSTLDWHQTMFESHFKWNNPQVKTTCGCGLSVGFV